MEDTTVSIIGIMIAAILMFIVPLVTIADRNDDISQLTVKTLTAQFVDNVIKTGKISRDEYQKYVTSLETSGNTYAIDIEIKILDENPAKRETDDTSKIGANAYYSIFTTQIEEKLRSANEIILKEGDTVSVTTKNNSKTLSQSLKSIYYTIKGEDLHIISATSSGTIAINGAT